MTTTFLEPGGDANFLASGGINSFWDSNANAIATDFVHGSHIKSISTASGTFNSMDTTIGSAADAGTRLSFYVYFATLPTSGKQNFALFRDSVGGTNCFSITVQSTGVLQLWRGYNTAQIGSDGATISAGVWYRISLAYTITSSSVNRLELFVNSVSSISVTNATIVVGATNVRFGNNTVNTSSIRFSDFYMDNSSSLTDTGNIWVTAKRPNANGTTNGFTTQVGAGGSGYGSGHSPQVNERPLSTTNGWGITSVGSAITEEYNIESKATGDIDISTATIIDTMGWVSFQANIAETINIIINGTNYSQAATTSATLYKKFVGSSTYPAGTGADIGVQTDTTITLTNLYECGVLVAYTPYVAPVPSNSFFNFM